MLLIDRIRQAWPEEEFCYGIPVIDASEVAKNSWGIEDNVNAAPPFGWFWIEATFPGAAEQCDGNPEPSVALLAMIDRKRTDDAVWAIKLYLYISLLSLDTEPFARRTIFVGKANGRIVDSEDTLWYYGKPDGRHEPYDSIGQPFYILYMAVTFLHCKNVEKIIEGPSRAERRRAERKGYPELTYRTVIVDPNKVKTRYNPEAETGIKMGMHEVRGHFANYTADHPLFGRTVGTFWVPPHLRGNPDYGVIEKDYKVLPGDPQKAVVTA